MSKQEHTDRVARTLAEASGFRHNALSTRGIQEKDNTQMTGHREESRRDSGMGEQDTRPLPKTGEPAGVWSRANKSRDSLTGNEYEGAQFA